MALLQSLLFPARAAISGLTWLPLWVWISDYGRWVLHLWNSLK